MRPSLSNRQEGLLFSVLETALFRNLCVNLRFCLCGVKYYASAQKLDFLDLEKNCSFPKQQKVLLELELQQKQAFSLKQRTVNISIYLVTTLIKSRTLLE